MRTMRKVEQMSKVQIPDVLVFEQSATAAVTLTEVLSATNLSGRFRMLNIEVENVGGTNAIDQFVLYGRVHPDASWHSLEATWTTASGWLIIVGGLAAIAHSTSKSARVNVEGLHSIKASVACAANTTAVTVRGMVSG